MARTSLKNIMRLVNDAMDEMSVEQMFLGDLKRSIEMQDIKDARKPSQSYKPSMMNCMRQSYYQLVGKDPEKDPKSCLVGICESGTDRHERIQMAVAAMKDNNMDCEYVDVAKYVKSHKLKDLDIVSQQGMETKLFNKKYNISFLCDGIIKYKGKYYILEIKTESSFKWQSREGVDPSHYHQAITYSLSFGIDEVIFLYENRDTCDKKAYMFKVTDQMKMDMIGYISNCDDYVKQGKVPPRLADTSSKACRYCDYAQQCRRDG